MATMTSGKLVNLMRLADGAGRFHMLAIDQRDSLRNALGKATGHAPAEIMYEEMATTKALITEILAAHSTATLVDPVYGLPRAIKLIPADVGILVAAEETGYDRAGPDQRQRKSRLVDGWSVTKAKRAGANAVKLLIYYNPEASADVLTHQQQVVRSVGADCQREDVPFLLELVAYPIGEPSADTPEFARKRPQLTIASAREFSKDEYQVDILKLEFPGDLKYSRQYCRGTFDGKERPAVYDLDDLRRACRELNDTATRPWVILSGGVDIAEFLVNLEMAVATGASGFLCGRAIWKGAIPLYPDLQAMRDFLSGEGVDNFTRANAVADGARPWFEHPRFGTWSDVQLAQGQEGWYQHYAATHGSLW